jgi:hypothetical protein
MLETLAISTIALAELAQSPKYASGFKVKLIWF